MPEEELWASFFEPELILDRLGLQNVSGDLVEFGCGYGTFTLPAAKRTTGTVYALEIEPELAALVQAKAAALADVRVRQRDFVLEGTGLADASAEYVMLFHILHAEEAPAMLAEARRVLRPGGLLGVIHWNYDERTPRGPNMEIRQRPQECRDLVVSAGFVLQRPGIIDLPPYHYGMTLRRGETASIQCFGRDRVIIEHESTKDAGDSNSISFRAPNKTGTGTARQPEMPGRRALCSEPVPFC